MNCVISSAWLKPTPQGLYCVPGDFYVDPWRPAARAVVTHGHADHARPGNGQVLATPGTAAIMRARYREHAGQSIQEMPYGETVTVNGVQVSFIPAGHVLGSAQAVLEWKGSRVIVSGDYKRRRDPTCEPFTPLPCDVFITEATFGLPVFRHPPDAHEIQKALNALALNPDRCLLVGVYALGKCQRLICLLREAGHDAPIYLHGALIELCHLYISLGVNLGDIRPVAETPKEQMQGRIVLCPPSALNDRWSRRLPDPITALASGWMTVRARAKQKGVEVPLILSDHADWDELTQTLSDVGAPDVWVTHGAEEALVHFATQQGFRACALEMVGYDDEEET